FMAQLIADADDPDAKRREFNARQPTGRMVAPEEVARAVAFLAHPSMRSTTGTTVVVDGGMGMIRLPKNT
ncbi:MAG: SDR family oxidoreductase, partial [Planctomycetota bacterium]